MNKSNTISFKEVISRVPRFIWFIFTSLILLWILVVLFAFSRGEFNKCEPAGLEILEQAANFTGLLNPLFALLAFGATLVTICIQIQDTKQEMQEIRMQRDADRISAHISLLPYLVIHTHRWGTNIVLEVKNHGHVAYSFRFFSREARLSRALEWHHDTGVVRELERDDGAAQYPSLSKEMEEDELHSVRLFLKPTEGVDQASFDQNLASGGLKIKLKVEYQLANGFQMSEDIEVPEPGISVTSKRSAQCESVSRRYPLYSAIIDFATAQKS